MAHLALQGSAVRALTAGAAAEGVGAGPEVVRLRLQGLREKQAVLGLGGPAVAGGAHAQSLPQFEIDIADG